MTALQWDQTGNRKFETGVDHGVLYEIDEAGEYSNGFAWDGLTTVTESPSGAEATPSYADNIKYLNLISPEVFGGTIEAYSYPLEFEKYDGNYSPVAGLTVGQQNRRPFGFCYRTQVGNDIEGTDYGYKLHLIYGAVAAPSEKAHATINDSPEPLAFSWEISTTPVQVGVVGGTEIKPTSTITVDSTKFTPELMATLEGQLYGDSDSDPSMPLPIDVINMLMGTSTEAVPTEPVYNAGTHTITIPTVTGVKYTVDGVTKAPGALVITEDTGVKAYPLTGYHFPDLVDDFWVYDYS